MDGHRAVMAELKQEQDAGDRLPVLVGPYSGIALLSLFRLARRHPELGSMIGIMVQVMSDDLETWLQDLQKESDNG